MTKDENDLEKKYDMKYIENFTTYKEAQDLIDKFGITRFRSRFLVGVYQLSKDLNPSEFNVPSIESFMRSQFTELKSDYEDLKELLKNWHDDPRNAPEEDEKDYIKVLLKDVKRLLDEHPIRTI